MRVTCQGCGREFRATPSAKRKHCSFECRYSRTESELTPREIDILERVALGWTTPHIGHELGISPKTVKSHLEHIYFKMGAVNRANAIAIALTGGLISYPT